MKKRGRNEQDLQRAVGLHQQGRLAEAEAIYQRILRSDPPNHRVLNLVGLAGFQRGDVELSIRYLMRAATIAPRVAKYRYDLGVVEQTRGEVARSIAHYEAAVALDATVAATWENLGVALFDQNRNDEAVAAFERALSLAPASLLALGNLATLRRWQGDHQGALTLIERGLALDPLNAELRMKRAELLLALGEFAPGWDDYSWRFIHGGEWGATPTAFVPVPKWSGEPLAGRSVLLHAEQGIGDEVMFASCLPALASLTTGPATRLTLLCDPRLAPTMRRSFPFLAVVANAPGGWGSAGEQLDADVRIPLGDLPRLCRMSAADFATRSPYLVAAAQARAVWRRRLDALGAGAKVGITWRGGSSLRTRQARSTGLAALGPLFSVPGMRFVSLQYGDCDSEIAAAPDEVRTALIRFPDLDPLADLDGLLALTAELDLVISVDNSTVHLAGALGAETWMLTPALADWRWPVAGADSRWYDSVRLFRQRPEERGEWGAVIDEVASALAAFEPRGGRPVVEPAARAVAPPAAPSGSRTLLVNDTSRWYHWGCTCTSLALREGLRTGGRQVRALPIESLAGLAPLPSGRADLADLALFDRFRRAQPAICAALEEADEVFINGEGSLHGAAPAALSLLWLAWIARRRFDKPVRIINHSCYPTGGARSAAGPLEDFYREVYGCLDTVVVREPVSAALLAGLGIRATQGFDCLPLYAQSHAATVVRAETDHVLVAGSAAPGPAMIEACARVVLDAAARGLRPLFLFGANANLAADDREFARQLGRATDGAVGLFHATSEAEFLSVIASARLLVSGRFHYSIAAAWLGTPFIALDSNTPKMDGLMQVLGLDCRVGAGKASFAPDTGRKALALLDEPAVARISDETRASLLAAARRNFDE